MLRVMYYNKDILEKAGVELNADGKLDIGSLDDFKAMLDKVKAVMGDGESPIALTNTGDDPYRVWWATYFRWAELRSLTMTEPKLPWIRTKPLKQLSL